MVSTELIQPVDGPRPGQIGDQHRGAGDRDVLEHQQIHRQRAQVRAVHRGRAHPGRRGRGRCRPAAAAASVQPVLDHDRGDGRDVVDLAAHHARRAAPRSDRCRSHHRRRERDRRSRPGRWSGTTPTRPRRAAYPGAGPLRRRAAREGDTAGPSVEGGCEELLELRPSRRFSSATSACNCSIVRACASISARSSSRDGCSDPDTAHDQHTDGSRSRTDTPQDRRPEPEWLRFSTTEIVDLKVHAAMRLRIDNALRRPQHSYFDYCNLLMSITCRSAATSAELTPDPKAIPIG